MVAVKPTGGAETVPFGDDPDRLGALWTQKRTLQLFCRSQQNLRDHISYEPGNISSE